MTKLNETLEQVTLGECIKAAEAAFAERRWEDAFEYWDQVRQQDPEHEIARIRAAQTLFELTYFEEARELAEEHSKHFPNRIETYVLLGDIAFALNEYRVAYKYWEFVCSEFPDTPIGFAKLAKLAEKHNIKKAVDLWREIEARFPQEQGAVFIALSRILSLHDYWHLARENMIKLLQKFPESPQSYFAALAFELKYFQQHDKLLFEHDVQLLNSRSAYAQKRFPKVLAVQSLGAKLAFQFHNYQAARNKLSKLTAVSSLMPLALEHVKTLLVTGEKKAALATLLSKLPELTAGNVEEFCSLFIAVSGALDGPESEYKIEALPEDPIVVLELIHQLESLDCFDVALQILDMTIADVEDWAFLSYIKAKDRIQNAKELLPVSSSGDLPRAEETSYLFAYDHIPQEQRVALEAHLSLIKQVEAQHTQTHLNTNQSPFEAYQIATQLIEAIRSKTPFSMVRPDGVLLPYSIGSNIYLNEMDQAKFEKEQWNGNQFSDQALYQQAILNSDIIGISERYHEAYLDESPSSDQRRISPLLSFLSATPAAGSTLTSSEINHDLQIWGLYDLILSYVDSVAIISDAPIGDKLMTQFGVGTRFEYLVPPEYIKQIPLDVYEVDVHYPQKFQTLYDELEVAYPGELFLVNAGVLGSIYCDRIKEKGGIAIDIGETLVLWGESADVLEKSIQEKAPFYRANRTSLWWHYLDAAQNIPYQQNEGERAKTYWINLPERADRRQATEQNLEAMNVPHERVEAVSPEALPHILTRPGQHNLLDVEKACLASHMIALKQGLVNGDQTFFVREDDLQEIVPVDFEQLSEKAPKDWDVLQLHTHGLESLQQGYLAYLSGRLWLPWDWRNPSTALYLTRKPGAKKIIEFVKGDAEDVLDLRSATPSLAVADRALYRDFNTYTSTYPFTVTSGSQSDILRINSVRHTNAGNLAKRVHVMTHPENPQLKFAREHSIIREHEGQSLVIGLGASPSGAALLQQILSQQQSSFVSNRMSQHPFRFPAWENDLAHVIGIVNYMLQTRPTAVVGDIMSAYLPYVEPLLDLDPTIKFICLTDDVESVVDELLHLRPHTNIYQKHDGIAYQHDQIYDRSAPKFEPGIGKLEAIKRYVALYDELSADLASKYPANFYQAKTTELTNQDDAFDLLRWLGYSNLKFLEHPLAFNDFGKTAQLHEFGRQEAALREKELGRSSFVLDPPSLNKAPLSNDEGNRSNLFEIHLFRSAPTAKGLVNFTDDRSGETNISLHIDFRRNKNQIVLNNRVNAVWGTERGIQFDFSEGAIVYVYYDELFHAAHLLDSNKRHLLSYSLNSKHQLQFIKANGSHVTIPSQERPKITHLWRYSDKTSGFKALPDGLELSSSELNRGLSLIIRAKNEEGTIEKCLTTVLPNVDEVIFVDNGSTDQTRLIAERVQRQHFNLKVFSYPFDIPRIGSEHGDAVVNASANTLGHYYNWCLAKSTTMNFAKWDADYICLEENFAEMVKGFQLRTRGDNFVIWFSGLEVYTDGKKYWVDTNSQHNEYRIFSRKHGAHWVNLPPWEEVEQSYIYRAHKLVYEKPVYLELFRLDEVEFRDRGIFTGDTRDKVRMETIHQFRQSGALPESFVEVSGLDDPKLKKMPLSAFELKDIDRANRAFSSLPNITLNLNGSRQTDPEKQKVANVFTAILSCRKNRDKQEIQRKTWVKEMMDTGFTYAFVEGEIGRPSCLIDDRLILDCRDEYEFLAAKVLEIVKWVYYETNFDYLLKVDDDVILNPTVLAKFEYDQHDYIGGRLITKTFDPTWHANKTWNEQLSKMYFQVDEVAPYFGGQFSYFLSRKAMKVIIDHGDILRAQLYEDTGVARTLLAGGIHPAPVDPGWVGRNYAEWKHAPQYKACCISDIPIGKMKKVYKQWVNSLAWDNDVQAFNENYDVSFDWMDIPSVIAKLKTD